MPIITFLIYFSTSTALSQDSLTYTHSIRRPMLPYFDGEKFYSLDDEIAAVLIQTLNELYIYDILVTIEVDSSVMDAKIRRIIIRTDTADEAREVIAIDSTAIEQRVIAKIERPSYFDLDKPILQHEQTNKASNIRTNVRMDAKFVDTETKQVIGTFHVDVGYTGGDAAKSRKKALEKFRHKVYFELKQVYWFSTTITAMDRDTLIIPVGSDDEVYPGMMFDVVNPERVSTDKNGQEKISPYRYACVATVFDTTANESWLRIQRKWGTIDPNNWLVEHPIRSYALQINCLPAISSNAFGLAVSLVSDPMKKSYWGFGMKFIQVTDSYLHSDYGFGFSGIGGAKCVDKSRLDFCVQVGLDLDIPFRKDDDENTVSTLLFSSNVSLIGELPLSRQSDLLFGIGYRISNTAKEWNYSDQDETIPAYWEQDAPHVDNRGIIFTMGYRYMVDW
ncbi:hypothetical protein JW960_23190 [candidate division KSB1 bacterium]|nr:hypothetical protein [candidate division KSB1 bacterium]